VIRDELEGVWHILLKDLKAYYFKPPNISWGILFPLVLALAFTLRNPAGLADLAPGLIAMAALFGTTSMEAIVITFEKRVGALERLIMAPVSLTTILVGKVLGGAVFGLVIAGVMTLISLLFLNVAITYPILFITVLILTVLAHSALGALVAVSVKEVFEAQTLSNYFRFPPVPDGVSDVGDKTVEEKFRVERAPQKFPFSMGMPFLAFIFSALCKMLICALWASF